MKVKFHIIMVNGLMGKRLIVVSILVVILITVLGFYAFRVQNPTKQIEFQTIGEGGILEHKEPAYYVIRNKDEWADIWSQHKAKIIPEPSPPKVNFSESIVIAVFMGEVNTGQHKIEIKEITDMGQFVLVKVEKTYPSYGRIVNPVLTQPYQIVKMDKIDKEITFDTVERII